VDPACVDRGLAKGSVARALATTIDDRTRERLRGELGAAITQKRG